jgi:hypothetical protein
MDPMMLILQNSQNFDEYETGDVKNVTDFYFIYVNREYPALNAEKHLSIETSEGREFRMTASQSRGFSAFSILAAMVVFLTLSLPR